MTEHDRRKAIAEACGWTDVRMSNPWELTDPPDDKIVLCGKLDSYLAAVPNYLEDLNAIAKAETILSLYEQHQYGETLARIMQTPDNSYSEILQRKFLPGGWGYFLLATMTAAERAEAFLRIKGMWKD